VETRLPSSRTISANGIELFLLEEGEGPLVVLCHGWPELSYSWRHQIKALAQARISCGGAGHAEVRPNQRARRYLRL
jgi:pimeloyl-ACP methyl ester carboxylesterase